MGTQGKAKGHLSRVAEWKDLGKRQVNTELHASVDNAHWLVKGEHSFLL